MQKSIVEEYEKQERKENMNIEDCKTVNEFFGVERKGSIWIEGKMFAVYTSYITSDWSTIEQDGKALVGCLTGQLKWSKHEPMTEEEEKLLREIAAWMPNWRRLTITKANGIEVDTFNSSAIFEIPFAPIRVQSSKAYEVLAPILEKYGEINLDEYRESN